MSRTHVYSGDVLLNITGASIGRSTYVPDTLGSANVNQHVCIIRTDPCITPKYLSYWFNSPLAQNLIFTLNAGVTRQGFNYSHIRSFPVPFTSLQNQNTIIEEIERYFSIVSDTDRSMERGLKQVERLRQSILRTAFEGKLLSQDPTDEHASVLLQQIEKERMLNVKNVHKITKSRDSTKQMRLP